ncbi:tRNA 2-thiouridine(34) synthase MnmA [Rhodopila globiformis]|uniref:tRNA-specific 2-thiouridylase MnmA n=1 Tax=Rhodopila globiformis TaxID=1071 RepID=A0A2S6MWU7_RHOGL|nr:tRNA 2-thiouridine(34) synthase MnmA [Rhodopila globiformis]PPQ26828.1 tRNA 2-thiouridine(34) synthase MnmA [Rhodopila globiformis]
MRVMVAMSGGVDSSVVAGLLHEAGHEVIGVTLQLYDHGAATARKGACCAGQDIHDARRVADRLGIRHYVIDAEDRFAKAVIADFADSYARGETPVPCIRCNQTVKFADLSALAIGLGAERLATGHYVRRIDGPDGAELHRAADPGRDQSWFLFATTRQQLDMSLFPLGGMTDKRTVRDIAQRLGLGVAEKPDSQDICFVPSGAYTDVVAKVRPDALEPGEIVSSDGRVVGTHEGIAHYTVGQGKRLGNAAVVNGRRQFVIATEPTRRRVVVGPRDSGTRLVSLRDINWLIPVPEEPVRCTVKLRAHEPPRTARVRTQDRHIIVELDEPALPAPGQACVFYHADRVLGGGFIARTNA